MYRINRKKPFRDRPVGLGIVQRSKIGAGRISLANPPSSRPWRRCVWEGYTSIGALSYNASISIAFALETLWLEPSLAFFDSSVSYFC